MDIVDSLVIKPSTFCGKVDDEPLRKSSFVKSKFYRSNCPPSILKNPGTELLERHTENLQFCIVARVSIEESVYIASAFTALRWDVPFVFPQSRFFINCNCRVFKINLSGGLQVLYARRLVLKCLLTSIDIKND